MVSQSLRLLRYARNDVWCEIVSFIITRQMKKTTRHCEEERRSNLTHCLRLLRYARNDGNYRKEIPPLEGVPIRRGRNQKFLFFL
jgi:hypothetical protein